MTTYIIRRLVLLFPTVVLLSVIVFLLMDLTPGNAIDTLTSGITPVSEEYIQAYKQRFHLDDPLWVRYGAWIWQLMHGNLGMSLRTGTPIADLYIPRLSNTLKLVGLALLISTIMGVTVGVISGVMRYSIFDYITTSIIFFSLSMPGFFFGLLGIYLFAIKIPIFPAGGSRSPLLSCAPSANLLTVVGDQLYHLVLPAVTLGLILSAYLMRFTRSAIVEELQKPYVITARSKGLSNVKVISKHVLRNALIPVITVLSNRVRKLVGGAVAVEIVFQYPGIGTLFRTSLDYRDYPVVAVITLFSCLLILFVFLLADFGYALVNPKIRYD